jgi:microcystin-dependent protein
MAAPQYVRRSYGGGAAVAQLVLAVGSADTTFTISPVTGWVEEDGISPAGTSGPFTVVIDRFTAQVEKILCSAINISTGVVTVYTSSDGWTGRGYDGTTPQTHVPNGSTAGVQTCWSSIEANEANTAVYDLLGAGGSSSLGVPIGTLIPFAGTPNTLPPNYLVADATPISRATYGALFTAITLAGTGTTTLAGATITGVSSAITPYINAGMKITGTNLGALGTVYTVSSVGTTSIVLTSGTGVVAGTAGAIVVYPHGAGNGSSTFNLPDARGRVVAGQGAVNTNAQPSLWVGNASGEQLHILAQNELSTALGTAAPQAITITDPQHNHNIGSNVYLNNTSSTVGPVVAGGGLTTSGLYTGQLTTNSSTGITASAGASAVTNSGGGQGHNNMQPYLVATHIIRAQ